MSSAHSAQLKEVYLGKIAWCWYIDLPSARTLLLRLDNRIHIELDKILGCVIEASNRALPSTGTKVHKINLE